MVRIRVIEVSPTPDRDVEFYPSVLRAIRLLHPGRSASSVADDAGVPRGSYWGYENGTRVPPAEQSTRIAEVLRVPVEAFYRARRALQEDAVLQEGSEDRGEVASARAAGDH